MGAQSNIQVRTLDPYQRLDSDLLNRYTKIIVPGGRGITQGLQVTKTNDTEVKVGKGLAVKEYVLIEYIEDVDLVVDTTIDEYKLVVMSYNYQKIQPAPEAEVKVVRFSEYIPTTDLVLKIIYVNGNVIESLHDVYPLDPEVRREWTSYVQDSIDEHNNSPIAHPDIWSAISQIVAGGMEITVEAGEIISEFDPVCLIDNKMYKATNDFSSEPLKVYLVGMAKADTFVGQLGVVQIGGSMSNIAWNFVGTTTQNIFLDGVTLTDTIPTTGSVIIIGTKQDLNTILIKPQILYLR